MQRRKPIPQESAVTGRKRNRSDSLSQEFDEVEVSRAILDAYHAKFFLHYLSILGQPGRIELNVNYLFRLPFPG